MKTFRQLQQEMIDKHPSLEPTSEGMSKGFADIVFSYRIRQKLTQQQLADKSDVGVKTIHRIEGGSGGVTINTLEKVLGALGIYYQDALDYLNEQQKKKAQNDLIQA